jgi:serine protease
MHALLTRPARLIAAALVVAALSISGLSVGHADTTTLPLTINGKHMMWGLGQGYPSTEDASASNLIYHGGLVETTPAVYLVYWGPEWQSGFSFQAGGYTYTQKTVETYVNSFFQNVGGSHWANIQAQYCDNITPPSFSCAGQPYAQFVTNPTRQLKGVWVDPSAVPSDITTTGLAENETSDPIETEAENAAAHFGYDINATYIILTQPGTQATAYGSVYCAYHAETPHGPTDHGVRYAFVPYVPDQGTGCGENNVNATDDAFGHGYLDGYSIVAGHEYAEAVTDPDNFNSTQDGWNDVSTEETGDKCAWTNTQNISLGKQYFAVQPLWSNEANGGQGACVIGR